MKNTIGENVRMYRENKAWTQEQLAGAAGVSPRTVQRIEAGGPASAESLIALANAFKVDVEALQVAVPSDEELAAARERVDLVELELVERGSDLGKMLGGCMARVFECVRLEDDELEDEVAFFNQLLGDWMDLWSDSEPVQQRDAEKSLQEGIKELRERGLVVAATRKQMRLDLQDGGKPVNWPILFVVVSKADRPIRYIVRDKTQPMSFNIC